MIVAAFALLVAADRPLVEPPVIELELWVVGGGVDRDDRLARVKYRGYYGELLDALEPAAWPFDVEVEIGGVRRPVFWTGEVRRDGNVTRLPFEASRCIPAPHPGPSVRAILTDRRTGEVIAGEVERGALRFTSDHPALLRAASSGLLDVGLARISRPSVDGRLAAAPSSER